MWMYVCGWCVYLCICHDEWIPCVVSLKPKLPGPVVDSCVSPTHCPRGSQDQDHCSGSVCSHTWNTSLDYTGLKYDSSQGERVEEGPLCCFAQMHTRTQTHTHTYTLPATIATSQAQRGPCGSTHLPKTDVKNKSERSSDWREAPHCRNSTNSLHSTLTGEQTAAHDNTHQWWKYQ